MKMDLFSLFGFFVRETIHALWYVEKKFNFTVGVGSYTPQCLRFQIWNSV